MSAVLRLAVVLLALCAATASRAAIPTTLPSTRPTSDTAPTEFAPPGDAAKATDVHAATAEEINVIADRLETAAVMDDRRYALRVRYYTRTRDGTAEQRDEDGVAERRAGGRRYDLAIVRRILPELRPDQRVEDVLHGAVTLEPGRRVVVVNPAERFAAVHELPFANPQGYQGKFFDAAMLSQREAAGRLRARPGAAEANPEPQVAAAMIHSLPPEPARFAFHGGEANGKLVSTSLRDTAARLPAAGDPVAAVELARVPRGGGEGGEPFEVLAVIARRVTAATRPANEPVGGEFRTEYWFDPEQGGLLVFRQSLTDGEPTPAAETLRVAYRRADGGAWLPVYGASWRCPIPPDPARGFGEQPASFVFALAVYDSIRPDPAAGGFTWRDLGLRPEEDVLVLQSDDPARNGGFMVVDGDLLEMNEAARRMTEDGAGGL